MSSFKDLPRELQSTVLSLLPSSTMCSLDNSEDFPNADDFLEIAKEQHFGDLARAALVCRQWRCLAEDPLLWRDYVLCLDSSRNLDLLPGMDRFSAVRSLVVRTVSEEQLSLLDQQLGARTEGGKLETLVVLHQGFRRLLSFQGIVQAVPLLKNFMAGGWVFLGSACSEALFAELAGAMNEGRSKLQSLSLGGCPSLHSIPPVQLARVVAGLRKADIGDTYLKKSQVAALMVDKQAHPGPSRGNSALGMGYPDGCSAGGQQTGGVGH
jgi:hypothetical protein